MSNGIRVCVDQQIPLEGMAEAQRLSIAANPDNYEPPSAFEAAAETRWVWANGSTIKVKFLDGDPVVQQRVEAYAHQWSKYANIKFDFGDHSLASIRISFKSKGQSWSYIGTRSLFIFDQTKPTMNFGWLEPDSPEHVVAGVVLHEFGHALGLIHEHQHPENGIQWDREAVMAYYTGPPNNWEENYVESNVLNAFPRSQTQFSKFDTQSIMLYPIPKEHILDDRAVDWDNDALSETDIKFIGDLYPFPETEGNGDSGDDLADADDQTDDAGSEPNPEDGAQDDSDQTLVMINTTDQIRPMAAPAPGAGELDGDERIKRNQLAYAIRSEVQNLQSVFQTIQTGEANLKDNAAYVQKTVADIPPHVLALTTLDGSDQARNIENLWERMQFNPLLQDPAQEFEAQAQANYLNLLDKDISRIIALVGDMTIPDRINEWLDQSRPGYYFSFHEVFEDELPAQADRERLLKFLGWAPEALQNGLVDRGSGLIYRYDDDSEAQARSKRQLLYTLLGTVAFILILAVPSLMDASWLLKMAQIPALLISWLAVLTGILVHVMIGSYKRSREPGGLPPIVAIGDFSLWLNAKTGQIILRLGLALFALLALVFGTAAASVTPLNAFLLGYSLDSFIEIFSGSLDSQATNLTNEFKKQNGGG